MCSSNFAFQELILRSLRASPLMKPFLTPGGWQESKGVYWKVNFNWESRVQSPESRVQSWFYTMPFSNMRWMDAN